MDFDDPRWSNLEGGYRTPYDPRNALRALERGGNESVAWEELWNELHHQSDVGVASYAAVPHLVRIYAARGITHWNTYTLVATIDGARRNGHNPALPEYLRTEYEKALEQLAQLGLQELKDAKDPELARSIFAVLAIWKGLFVVAQLVGDFSEIELEELVAKIES